MATLHTGIRAYAFGCTYPTTGTKWQDTPSTLHSAIGTALSGISGMTYDRHTVACVKNAGGDKLEIEVINIVWSSKTKLNATENDSLITALQDAFDGVTNFTYTEVNIVNDRFEENITAGWPGQSFQEV